jgi:hypothetical protein
MVPRGVLCSAECCVWDGVDKAEWGWFPTKHRSVLAIYAGQWPAAASDRRAGIWDHFFLGRAGEALARSLQLRGERGWWMVDGGWRMADDDGKAVGRLRLGLWPAPTSCLERPMRSRSSASVLLPMPGLNALYGWLRRLLRSWTRPPRTF